MCPESRNWCFSTLNVESAFTEYIWHQIVYIIHHINTPPLPQLNFVFWILGIWWNCFLFFFCFVANGNVTHLYTGTLYKNLNLIYSCRFCYVWILIHQMTVFTPICEALHVRYIVQPLGVSKGPAGSAGQDRLVFTFIHWSEYFCAGVNSFTWGTTEEASLDW